MKKYWEDTMIRFFDIIMSLIGLILFSPIFVIISFFIVTESSGGIFYTQTRIGKDAKPFKLYKFRSMIKDVNNKKLITVGLRDPRITKTGYTIRKFKLDELPQLINVLKGDMSFVGPRPEVKKYVDMYTSEQMHVLSVKPGITDYASIEYAFENEILEQAEDPDKTYIETIMPDKIEYNMKYINNRSLKEYFRIIFLTFKKIL